MESFGCVASNRTYRTLCKYHLLYDEKFLTNYFDTITRQEEENERSKIEIENVANSNRVRQSRRRQLSFRWKLALISHYIEFRILYHTTLWMFDSQIPERLQVFLLNQFGLEHFDPFIQIFIVLYLVFARDILPLLYLRNRGLTFRVLREAIVENRNSFFPKSRYRFSNCIVRFFAGPDDLISRQLLSLGICTSNIFIPIAYLLDLHNLKLIIELSQTQNHFSPFDYAIMCSSVARNMLLIHIVFRILALMAFNGILGLIVAYVRLTQIEHLVRRHFHRKPFIDTVTFGFPAIAFYRFRDLNVSMLQYLADLNRIYGKVLFDFILTNVPFNSLLIGLLLTGQLRGPMKLIAFAIIAAQMSIMIGLNLAVVILWRRMHQMVKYFFPFIADPDLRVRRGRGSISYESKQVISLWRLKDNNNYNNCINNYQIKDKIKKITENGKFPRQQHQPQPQQISLRLRLQIARYIGDFHTNNQYTLNYGKYGAITFAAIKKQIFINIKLILFSYMLYQSKK